MAGKEDAVGASLIEYLDRPVDGSAEGPSPFPLTLTPGKCAQLFCTPRAPPPFASWAEKMGIPLTSRLPPPPAPPLPWPPCTAAADVVGYVAAALGHQLPAAAAAALPALPLAGASSSWSSSSRERAAAAASSGTASTIPSPSEGLRNGSLSPPFPLPRQPAAAANGRGRE